MALLALEKQNYQHFFVQTVSNFELENTF